MLAREREWMDAAMHQQGSRGYIERVPNDGRKLRRTLVRCRCQRPKNELDHSRTIAETASCPLPGRVRSPREDEGT
jgi:hypothetical protein